MKISFKKVNQPTASPVRELALILFLGLIGLVMHLGVGASDTDSVTATVTASQIAISVSDGSVSYGSLSVGSTQTTLSGGVNDKQTATNDGNEIIDLGIQGTNSSPDNWTLSNTAIGADQYMHHFSTDSGTGWTAMESGSYTTFAVGVGVSGTEDFDLNIHMPESTAATAEQNVNVSVLATAN